VDLELGGCGEFPLCERIIHACAGWLRTSTRVQVLIRASKDALTKLEVRVVIDGGNGVEKLVWCGIVGCGCIDNFDHIIDAKFLNESSLGVARVARLARVGACNTRLVSVASD
jgi:hypothetical protein